MRIILLSLLPSTLFSFLFFHPLYYKNVSDSMDPAGVILSQSEDPPSLWEMVKNDTFVEGNSTWIGNEFDETTGSLSLNTIGVVKRERRNGNDSDNLFEEWSNLLKVLNISNSDDSTSSNDSKGDSDLPSNDIFSRHWTLERLL